MKRYFTLFLSSMIIHAVPADGADFALRLFCRAACSPVSDQDVGEIAPLLLREQLHEVLFDVVLITAF